MKIYKIAFVVFFIHSFNISSSQENEKNKIQASDGIHRSSLDYIIKISDKLSLENRFIFSYNYDYQLIEIPLNLRYNLNEKWDLFTGPKLNYFIGNNSFLDSNSQEYNFSIQAGVKYNFSQEIFGEIKYEYNFSKNNKTSYDTFEKGALKFNFEYKF